MNIRSNIFGSGNSASEEPLLKGKQPKGAKPVLFMSGKSWFEANKPIRGGVPVLSRP